MPFDLLKWNSRTLAAVGLAAWLTSIDKLNGWHFTAIVCVFIAFVKLDDITKHFTIEGRLTPAKSKPPKGHVHDA